MVALGHLLPFFLIQLCFFSFGFTSPSSPAPSPSPSPSSSPAPSPSSMLGGGFKTRLIHRDAFGSPFYDPNLTEWDKTLLKMSRSKARSSNWDSSLVGFQAVARIRNGEFIMWFDVGLPLQPAYAVVDTGSNLIWIQCDKCIKCMKQKPRLFKPSASSTYKAIIYEDDRCLWLGVDSLGISKWDNETCQYKIEYGDNTRSVGHLSEDTFAFQQWNPTDRRGSIILRPIVFGCGLENTAQLNQPTYPCGVIGLSNHKLSLLSQLGLSQFSSCVSLKNETTINFGTWANIVGDRIPLMDFRKRNGEISDEDYYVSLLGISLVTKYSIDKLDIPLHFLEPALGGGALLDTGTSITVVPTLILDLLVDKLEEDYLYDKPSYDSKTPFPHCYEDITFEDLEELSIKLHFNGAELQLSTKQLWVQHKSDGWCLAMYSKGYRFLVIGTHILADYNIGYDLNKKEVSLMSAYC